MSFKFKKGERIPEGIRRVARNRIEKALNARNEKNKAISDGAVHDARKRFKEIRAMLRLVRGELGSKVFRRENGTFRNAARPLSKVRDAKVLLVSLDGLTAHFDRNAKPPGLARLRHALLKQRRSTRVQVIRRDRAVAGIRRTIKAVKKRVKKWPLHGNGWKAIDGGLRTIFAHGQRAMRDVSARSSDRALHKLRKRTKDLQYSLVLLQCLRPVVIKPLIEQVCEITNLLGDDHDLAFLRIAAWEKARGGSTGENQWLFELIDERRRALQKQAISLGNQLYKEDQRLFVHRLKDYWKAARSKTR